MKKTETKQILELLTQLTEAVIGPAAGRPPTEPKPSISERVDKLDDRVSEVQLGLATLAVDTKAQFQKVDERFQTIDARFDNIDARFTKVDVRFDNIDARFTKVDKRFDKVDRSIETARVQLVGLVELVHNELTGRIIDLEAPGRKGSGGGGSGVPLAS
jgi:tetrahydromethanopterin S-methyltransferase subunit G